MCEATRPDSIDDVSDDEFRGLPLDVQKKILADYRAWKAMGCE
ncbi:hypothetical protein HY17_04750 [Hyphomonas sp. CY54-11-8]|nr:hypothetical protein HY17_04750 [Hyphomonas sp. CY54-11-8]